MKSVSIIIPVYNTRLYLNNCIDSILKQDMTDYEVILVDDGSTDGSGDICDRYAEDYPHIKVIHQTNAGPATAKNAGLEISNSEYVYYMDSDDELMDGMLKILFEEGKKHNADIVCCSYLQRDEQGNIAQNAYSEETFVMDQRESLKRLLLRDKIYAQCWTKFYRKAILDKNNIRFINGLKTEEDSLFNVDVFLKSNKIVLIDKPLYLYTHREGGLSRDYHKHHMMQFLENIYMRMETTRKKIVAKHPDLNDTCVLHNLRYCNMIIGRLTSIPRQPYVLQHIRKNVCYMRRHILLLYKNHNYVGVSRIGALAFLMPSTLYYCYRRKKAPLCL